MQFNGSVNMATHMMVPFLNSNFLYIFKKRDIFTTRQKFSEQVKGKIMEIKPVAIPAYRYIDGDFSCGLGLFLDRLKIYAENKLGKPKAVKSCRNGIGYEIAEYLYKKGVVKPSYTDSIDFYYSERVVEDGKSQKFDTFVNDVRGMVRSIVGDIPSHEEPFEWMILDGDELNP